jgi:oligopeptide/dipeptide ABC transporter ATP-binding protein
MTTETMTEPSARADTPAASDLLLDVRDLRTYFHVMDGTVMAVDGVDFSLHRGETLGVVGESGCGKSVTAMTIMRLLDIPPAEVASGEILFEGTDLLKLSEEKMRQLRGKELAMIFQEPMSSLNPVFTIGDQISEAVRLHLKVSKKEAVERAIESLTMVGIPFPERRIKQYPHELSGGQRQRVMIAMALSCDPKLIIADEPTTALDVTIQAQILELLKAIQQRTGAAVLLITHDLGVVAEMADKVVVMYGGRVVERGTATEVLLQPRHPYTEGLLSSIPSKGMRGQRLNVIKGTVPNPFNMPTGCNFAPRCPYRFEPCPQHDPRVDEGDGPPVACWLWKQAPGYEIPERLRAAQIAAAREAGEAVADSTIEILEIAPAELDNDVSPMPMANPATTDVSTSTTDQGGAR